jgi:hypothetical protein
MPLLSRALGLTNWAPRTEQCCAARSSFAPDLTVHAMHRAATGRTGTTMRGRQHSGHLLMGNESSPAAAALRHSAPVPRPSIKPWPMLGKWVQHRNYGVHGVQHIQHRCADSDGAAAAITRVPMSYAAPAAAAAQHAIARLGCATRARRAVPRQCQPAPAAMQGHGHSLKFVVIFTGSRGWRLACVPPAPRQLPSGCSVPPASNAARWSPGSLLIALADHLSFHLNPDTNRSASLASLAPPRHCPPP